MRGSEAHVFSCESIFGDIVKVPSSSKVVGDMALFMVQNDLMETTEQARKDVVVKKVFTTAGDAISKGNLLIEI